MEGTGTACRTRSQFPSFSAQKYPLNPTPLATSTEANNLAYYKAMGKDYLKHSITGMEYGLPADSGVAGFTSGQLSWPVFNNNAEFTPQKCEVDICNQHVGQGGGGAHLHGDPFGPYCQYSSSDYMDSSCTQSNSVHPPQVGWANDGFPIHGRYLSYTAPGQSVNLDTCGGHDHDGLGYHYHTQLTIETTYWSNTPPFVASGTKAGVPYYVGSTGVYKCFKGDVSLIDNFFNDNTVENTYKYAAPCCGSKEYYVAPGIVLERVDDDISLFYSHGYP